MKRKLLGILFVFSVTSITLFAQDKHEMDSLENLLKHDQVDTTKLDILNTLAREWVDLDPDKSMAYANTELEISQKLKDKKQEAFAYLNIGNAYYDIADYKSSLESYIKALHLHEAINNKAGIGSCSGSIGNVYLDLHRPDDAIKYFDRALNIFLELGRKRGAATAMAAMATVYSEKKELKKSLEFNQRALILFHDIKALESEATVLNNIATLYSDMHEYDKALEFVMKARVIDDQTGNLYDASLTMNNIAELYLKMNDAKQAITFYQKAIVAAQKIEANDRIINSYRGLALAYKVLNDYKKAFEMEVMCLQVKDTVYNSESSKQMAEMQARFDSEKKEKEITTLTADKKIKGLEFENSQNELRKQRLINALVIAGLVIMAILAFFVFRGYRQKRSANLLLEEKNILIEEKNKEITDSILYAEKIQRAILPADNDFEKLFPDSFVLFKPKDIVSGDFYWAAEIGDKIFYATIDCTGHGVPGGFMSMLGNSLLNEIIIEKKIMEPAQVLDMLREKIISSLKQTGALGESKDGMDMILCCVNKKTYTLSYAAANNPLWIIRDGKVEEYPADKQPVGVSVIGVKQFTQQVIPLQKNDLIYTFTDGYADQFGGPKGKKFKYKQLEELLLQNHSKTMSEQRKLLDENIESWKGNLVQVDDILVIGVKI